MEDAKLELRPSTCGLFMVSKCGKVFRNDKLRATYKRADGYRIVAINIKGKQKHCYIHRLVAQVWLDNPKNYQRVKHKDLDQENNHVDNLEWVPHSFSKEALNKEEKR
ncbi:MAG: HNH endonuclease [Defluviitaleaceae bacterium]|nr:HNH endonuclease [Defluviitaleaceae bacterium]